MKTERIPELSRMLGCLISVFMLLIAMTESASAQSFFPTGTEAGTSGARVITWQGYVGTDATIPSTGTVVNCTLSPYNVPTNGTSNCATSIQNCINGISSGQVAYLPAGTYMVGSPISVTSNKVLRGAGMGSTIIKPMSSNLDYIVGTTDFENQVIGSAIAISSGATIGSTSIKTSSAHGWSVGQLVVIAEQQNTTGDPIINSTGNEGLCSGGCGIANNSTYPCGQLVKVATVPTSQSITFVTPLTFNYTQSPTGTGLGGIASYAGIESLTVNGTSYCVGGNVYGNVISEFCDSCWHYQVEIIGSCYAGDNLTDTYRNTVRSCMFHDINSSYHGPGGGYVILHRETGGYNLFEDNILYNGCVGIIIVGALAGNVYANNFIQNMYSTGASGRPYSGLGMHGAHPQMNLIEGNYFNECNISSDDTWGTSSNQTYLRNRSIISTSGGYGSPTSDTYDVQLDTDLEYNNYAGNVLGTVGFETNYVSSSFGSNFPAIYCLPGTPVTSTIFRQGNWDAYHNAQEWNEDITDSNHTIPNSLYLPSAPSYWCQEISWPGIDPANPSTASNPAYRRFNGLPCTPLSSGPAPPQNLQILP